MTTRKCERIHRKHGTEGPKHDPYGFTEFSFDTDFGEDVVVHLGLAEWVMVNGRKGGEELLTKLGLSYAAVSTAYDDQFLHCKKCGCEDVKTQNGMPGETIYVCTSCGSVVECYFNEGAVA